MDESPKLELAVFLARRLCCCMCHRLTVFAFAIVAAAVWLHVVTQAQATLLIVAS